IWDAIRLLVNPQWRSPGAFYAKGKTLRVTADRPSPMQMDGEYGGESPLDVRMTERTVRMLAPPQAAIERDGPTNATPDEGG
ncbi:MAG: hypothetical protein KDA33_17635, partial [Phycisphaerales bacterium]|nr:hypothetical protein [Phycisphaerales bacterium]